MALAFVSSLRNKLHLFKFPSVWKIIVIVYVLLNLKSLPFAWHLRLIHGLLTQVRTSRYRLAHCPGPSTLFAPIITSSRTPILETDYNLHKSNSTYFADSDVGRLHLMVALCGKGMDRVRSELDAVDVASGKKTVGWGWSPSDRARAFGVHLGGVSANFRREIKPYETYEMWTRVLCWDRKWLYIVQHFVKKGSVKEGRSLLQPWRNSHLREDHQQQETSENTAKEESREGEDAVNRQPHPAIFASLIAKYVFKKGRLTISPERVLRAAELLPSKLATEDNPSPPIVGPVAEDPSVESVDATVTSLAATAVDHLTPGKLDDLMNASLQADVSVTNDWDWTRVENERLRGMQIAELYSKLDALNDEFPGDAAPVLGHY